MNKEIVIEELHKLQIKEQDMARQLFSSNEFREGKIKELQEKLYVDLASSLLKKLNRLDRENVRDIIYNLLDRADVEGEQWCGDIIDQILSLIPEEGEVIFKAKLKKGENLSKVIEQVLYPKYEGKEIIIREVKQ